MNAKKIGKKVLKVFAWIIGIIIFLIVLVYVLIQVPAVQNFAKNKAIAYLEGKIKTKVEIGKFSLDFPKKIVLEKIYFEDQRKDTLLYGGKIRVDISLFSLLNNEVNLQYLELNGIKANIYRNYPDTSFNFDYIVKAFASEEEKKPEPQDTSAPMKFNIGKIVLKDITAKFKDDESGNNVYFYLGNFNTSIDTFDPDKLVYKIKDISIADINAKVYQYKPLIENKDSISPVSSPSESSSPMPTLQLNSLNLQRIYFNYRNDVSALLAFLKIGELSTHPENINLQNLDINLKDFAFHNSVIKVGLGKSQEAKETKDVVAAKTDSQLNNPWKFYLAKADFKNNELIYDDNNATPLPEGFDASHLHINNFVLEGDSLSFTPAVFQGNIGQLALNEKSGLALQKFHTKFYYSDTTASLTDLLLQTDGTTVQNKLIVKYPSIEAISKNIGALYIDASLSNSKISVKDFLAFMPSYKRTMGNYKLSAIKLNAALKGFVRDLSIPTFELSGYGDTYIKLSGRLQGLPDAKRAYYNVKINQFTSTKKDILSLLPPKTLPDNFNLPDRFALNGFLKGNTSAFNTQLALKTNKGNINVDGSMKPGDVYAVNAKLQNVDAGYLMKQQGNLGKVTANLTASGKGLDIKKANAKYNLDVASAEVKGYNYRGLNVNGEINDGVNTTKASINDSAIALNLDLTANLNTSSSYPPLKLDLLIDTLNAKALNLMSDTLSVSGHITADLPSTNPDDLVGTVNINNLSLTRAGQKLNTDSISLVAGGDSANKSIVIKAGNDIDAALVGQYKLTEIAQALQQAINQYYKLPGYEQKNITAQNWTFDATVRPQGLILQLAPDLKGSDSITVHAHLNAAQNDLGLTAKSRRIIVGTNQIDSLNVTAQSSAEAFNASLSVEGIKAGSTQLYKTAVNAKIANNQLGVDVSSNDSKDKTQYALGALLNQIDSGFRISLKPDLVLDGDKWNVGANNAIQYDSSGIVINNFSISQGNQSLSLNSTSPLPTAPIKIDLKNFEIATITKIAHQDSLLASGTINGTAEITNPTKDMVFTSDLTINNLAYKLDTIGNLAIKVDNKTANAYNADVSVTGKGNDVRLTGLYYTGESRMDLNLALNNLNLAMVKAFAAGQLDDIRGFLRGGIAIKGTTSAPDIDGRLNFANASFVPTISGERFTIPKDAIRVNSKGIHFNNFDLVDSSGNKATIDGDILTKDYKSFTSNLTLNADDFTVVNAPQATDRIVYGKLNIDAAADIKGDLMAPTVSGNLRVNKITDFIFVVPQSDPEVESREGVVVFVDKDNPADTAQVVIDSAAIAKLTGLSVDADIEIDSSAKFTVIIDERNGDALTLKGRANLNGGIDKSGKTTLTGAYELESGSYNLSLSLLKRQFLIQKGSTITWTGDPTAANIDVTAVYEINTPSIDLMQSSVSGNSTSEITKYKEKLPFQVLLHMTGELLKPVITFDIILPERTATQWTDVADKLQQVRNDEGELNKQVFALLLLGRFVQENPFVSSAGGTGVEGQIRASASRILTDQLNNLAGSLIKGVDVNFGVESGADYSTGTAQNRTDLNVTVSKKLLNDRLRVNVGSNFQLEGPSNANQNTVNPAGDVSVDYQLTKDGRYMIRVYRLNEYENQIDGQVIETGMSFILTYDYNKFSEIFTGRKEAKLIRKRNRKISQEQKQRRREEQIKQASQYQNPTNNP
ncbi:translocation/assembly module TamB domain-containing protein [Parafilimonas sp.]|uniref:translocation/assembly module TamB domain-containing protein n=1 Tax=Parafilimonas sp. TaxID=1969739 RepID=UPI0039E43432